MINDKPYTVQKLHRVTELHTQYSHDYIIYQDEHHNFWGIRREYIKNGSLVKPLNGMTGNLARTISDCILYCNTDSEFRHYESKGMSLEDIATHILDKHNAM